MKHAFCREVRFAGHRRAGLAAASRRLTVGRPFKAGALVPPSGSRAASAALESRTPLRLAISSVAPRRGMGLVCRDRPWKAGLPSDAAKRQWKCPNSRRQAFLPVLTCFRNESDRQECLSLRPLPPKSQNGQSQSLPLRGANENRTDLRRLPDTMPKYLTYLNRSTQMWEF